MSKSEEPNLGSDPQEIVEGIKLEEAQRSRGLLKIFLGMAAGVGKTYAMLEEAQILRREQIDVVVGNIETHERQEIEILLKDLPQISKKTYLYKDKEFQELNVETIISLRPSIVLVDELAHSNIAGSRNEKRWQDVEEILKSGISVYTTLNVQHIDSLNDLVSGIIGSIVKETVPDIMIEKADSIQLIDLNPEDLLQRLEEGKVYNVGRSETATLHFFQKNKLVALREILLRYVTEKIDIDLSDISEGSLRKGVWKSHEKFLVAISLKNEAQKLIKAARRLATQANASWSVVYVDTGKVKSIEDQELFEKLKTLASDLGSEIITIYDPDVAEGIKKVAYQRDISKIILGRSGPITTLTFFRGPTLLDKLAEECQNIDLHIMRL